MAQDCGADAIYPGYGFLSENPGLARACDDAGITFVGPPAEVLALAGSKVRAKEEAAAAGIPVLRSAGPRPSVDDLVAFGRGRRLPPVRKGGGGRRGPWPAAGRNSRRAEGRGRGGGTRGRDGLR